MKLSMALKCCSWVLLGVLAMQPIALAQQLEDNMSLSESISVPGGTRWVNLDLTGENVRDVLRGLAKQGGFNLVLDDSVSGVVTLELHKVSINQALQTISTLNGIEIVPRGGNIFLALSKPAALAKGLNRPLSKMIKIHYANAQRIANILNNSFLANNTNNSSTSVASTSTGSGTSNSNALKKVQVDFRTNSLIVLGTAYDIELAEEAVQKLDQPRQSKTFYLSHANAVNVASMLSSSIFNDGTNNLQLGGAGGSSSGASGASTGSSGSTGSGSSTSGSGSSSAASGLRVEQESLQEGSGINTFGGGSGSTSSSPLSQSVTLRATVKASQTINISPEGPLVVPDTRFNSVTVLGTAEQIALAESVIPNMDAQLPQVSIEASLIEVSEEGGKTLGNNIGIASNKIQFGFNNQPLTSVKPEPAFPLAVQPLGTGLTGIPTVLPSDPGSLGRAALGFTTHPLTKESRYVAQLNALVQSNKAKILANPTVVATHDTEAIISIVDEIIRSVTVTVAGLSGTTSVTTNIGEAGIVLDILPKVGDNGNISMRLRPSISSVRDVVTDSMGNITTLLNKRDLLTQQVQIHDGQTMVIAGLINQNDSVSQDKLPLLGDLPIVGALARASRKNNKKTELVLLITPHILNVSQPTPVSYNPEGSR